KENLLGHSSLPNVIILVYIPQSYRQVAWAKYLLGSYDELHFVAYFIACLDKLAETPNINAINWYHLQIAREGNYTSQESAQKFWQDIISHMEELKNVFKNVDPTAVLQNSYHGDIKTYPRIRGITIDRNILCVCFVFDES
ncbi:6495_t:CDS:2, partial [Entrophospora sp. SA101]